tara:strand:- start:62022 stop:62159 length:138 start_codon:yes stop_codon:yes gene_type:complete
LFEYSNGAKPLSAQLLMDEYRLHVLAGAKGVINAVMGRMKCGALT